MAPGSLRISKSHGNMVQGPSLKVNVGATKEQFTVHESLICTSSIFFKRAMAEPWKEGKEHTVELPEDDPKVFALYLHWLYFSNLPSMTEAKTEKEAVPNVCQEYRDLIDAYVLGDKLLDSKFQNSAIDAMAEIFSTEDKQTNEFYFCGAREIEYAFKKTTESSKIRTLFVDMYVEHAEFEWVENDSYTFYPHEFLFQVFRGLLKRRDAAMSPTSIKSSDYHVEDSGV